MKKQILLIAAICGMSFSTTMNAQMQGNKVDANVGFIGNEALGDGTFRMMYNFNLCDSWKTSKKPVTEKLSSSNGKGIYGMAITTEGINSNKAQWINNGKTENTGSNLVAIYAPSASVLIDSLSKSTDPLKHEYWKAACCFMDVPGTDGADQAFTIWPGMAKRRIMGFQVKAQDPMSGLLTDIQFDLLTLDKGTTGKTTTYKMIVDLSKQPAFPWFNSTYGKTGDDIALLDSICEANITDVNAALGSKMYVKDNIYTSSEDGALNRVTIKVAEAIGLKVKDLRGKKVMVTLYSTTSETPVQPGMYEPLVGVDNVTTTYGAASWIEPEVVENGRDTLNVTATYDVETPITFKLKGKNRMSALSIKSDGDNKTNASFYFKAEGCVMANDGNGNYNVPVAYNYTPVSGDAGLTLNIPADSDGSAVDDDLEVTLYVNFPRGKRTYSLEISNGTRFWLDIFVEGTATDIAASDISSVKVMTSDNSIIVENATEDVVIANTAGQIVKTVSAGDASKGIAIANGIYLVKTGNIVEKALVK